MSEIWAHVYAGAVSGATVVGGISLALRHARLGHRQGWTGIRFIASDEAERQQIETIFVKTPAPSGLRVEVLASEPGPGDVVLAGAGLYTGALLDGAAGTIAPGFTLQSIADTKGAERFLYAQIRKSVALDGVIAFYLMRPLGRVFTRGLLNTSVSPNQATLGALACGIAAAICAGLGTAHLAIFAGILYWFGGVIDCIDGELARMRLQSSKIGEWLDSMVDEFSTISLICGIGIGLARDGYGTSWTYLGVLGAIIATITLSKMYGELHRQALPIDTAQFPWFFDNPAGKDSEPSLLGKCVNFAGYFIRRDANLTGTAILLILNLRQLALILMFAAYLLASALLIVHYIVRDKPDSAVRS